MPSRTLPPVTATVTATWRGEHRFAVRGTKGKSITIDADKVDGTGPVDTLLGALATCTAVDVVDILAKRRTPAERLEIVITAERRGKAPRRVTGALLTYHIDGAGIDRVHAERAIALAVDKYCSVASSLAPDITLRSALVLNGESYPACARHVQEWRR